MASHTIKVTGVGEELLKLLDERIRAQHATGRSEYIRELIRKDVLGANGRPAVPKTFQDLLGPVHEATRQLDETEEETEEFLRQEIEAYRQERRAKSNHGG